MRQQQLNFNLFCYIYAFSFLTFSIKARHNPYAAPIFGSYFSPSFSHNPVLWRNVGWRQLCVLSRPSCVDLTRQSQTCWRQPPDVIHSPPTRSGRLPRPLTPSLPPSPSPSPLPPSLTPPPFPNQEAHRHLIGWRSCHSDTARRLICVERVERFWNFEKNKNKTTTMSLIICINNKQ